MEKYTPVALSPQSSSANNVFRPRRSDDWHEYREIIEQLYRNDQLKLRDVKRIMERDYKFYASEKQYKDRLAAWHVRKNIKAKEVHLMLRKQQKRAAQGKQTAFRVNGQNVDPKRIARFVRRYGTSWDSNQGKEPEVEPQSPEPQTPSDMTCYTPEPTDENSATTPISPLPDMQSPTREMPPFPLNSYDQNHLDNLPDLELDEGPGMPLAMHSPQPRHVQSYHHSIGNHLPHGSHITHNNHAIHATHATHAAHNALATHAAHGTHSVHGTHAVHAAHGTHGTHGTHSTHSTPVIHNTQSTHAQPGPAPRDLEDAPSEEDTHPPDWNTVESFQTRLQDLDYTLTQSMSKWAREQDPNAEIPHHEGLGM